MRSVSVFPRGGHRARSDSSCPPTRSQGLSPRSAFHLRRYILAPSSRNTDQGDTMKRTLSLVAIMLLGLSADAARAQSPDGIKSVDDAWVAAAQKGDVEAIVALY